jgi:hypothetical protein
MGGSEGPGFKFNQTDSMADGGTRGCGVQRGRRRDEKAATQGDWPVWKGSRVRRCDAQSQDLSFSEFLTRASTSQKPPSCLDRPRPVLHHVFLACWHSSSQVLDCRSVFPLFCSGLEHPGLAHATATFPVPGLRDCHRGNVSHQQRYKTTRKLEW